MDLHAGCLRSWACKHVVLVWTWADEKNYMKPHRNLSTCWADFLLKNKVVLYGLHLHLAEIQSQPHRLQMCSG